MQTHFYVSHSGHQMGPFQVEDIMQQLTAGSLSPMDYVYDDVKSDWVLFIEHEALSERVKALKPKAPPKPTTAAVAHVEAHADPAKLPSEKSHKVDVPAHIPPALADLMGQEWFVLKGENRFGPFAYVDVMKMLQQGVIFEFDFVWYQGLESWARIAELPAFSKDNVKTLKDTVLPELSEVFFRRRHRRVQYGATVLVHDNKSVWKGKGIEISEGGAGIVMDNALCVPGQQLFLHFKPGDGVPPFNAICEVVSKGFTGEVKDPKAPIKYGVKFKTMSPDTQKFLQDFTKKKAA